MDLGINLSGANWLSTVSTDVLGKNYFFPTEAEIDYYAAKGFGHIRLPLAWERLQPVLDGELDADYIALIHKTVEYARSQGIDVVLDVHNYGAYRDELIGSESVPVESFSGLWGRIATEFVDDTNVRFGLMNEPQLPTAAAWLSAANSAIAAIRDAGALQEILVPGAYWTGAHKWTTTDNASVIGAPGAIVDPANNFAFEVHQYLDNGSGQNDWVVSETIGVERLTAITEWARASGAKLYLGEFGVADNAMSLTALDNMMAYISQNVDVWQSVSYWAGGQANTDYMYSTEPDHGLLDVAQMDVLENYGSTTIIETDLGNGQVRQDVYIQDRAFPTLVDVLDASGALVSRTLFDSDGNERSHAILDENGLLSVKTYDIAGEESAYKLEVFDADDNLVSRAVAYDNGSMTIKYFHPGEWSAYREDGYGTDGKLWHIVEHLDNGHTVTRFSDGLLSAFETYDSSWKMLTRDNFDAEGHMTMRQIDHADGTHTRDSFDIASGLVIRSIDYSTNWTVVSVANFDDHGVITDRTITLENGLREVEHYLAGANDHTDILTAGGQLVSRTIYNETGLLSVVYVAPGSDKIAHTTQTDADGHVVWTSNTESDGTLTVHRYFAGSEQLEMLEKYDATGHLTLRTSYNSEGNVTTVQIENTDGTHTLQTFSVENQATPTLVDQLDADFKLLSRTHFDLTGQRVALDTIHADGRHTIDYFVPGSDLRSSVEEYSANGHMETRTTFGVDGLIALIQRDHDDGSHTQEIYDTADQQSPAYVDSFDADWNMLSRAYHVQNLATSIGASEEIVGISVEGEGGAQIINQGTISGDDYAVRTDRGTLELINEGAITGNVYLGAGNDTFEMAGGTLTGIVHGEGGNDVYKIADSTIQISEEARGGQDTVITTLSFKLGNFLENAAVDGDGDISIKGNGLANKLFGADGDNRLAGHRGSDIIVGAGGDDRLIGGAGADCFVFDMQSGDDVIRDFRDNRDLLKFDFIRSEADVIEFFSDGIHREGRNTVISYGDNELTLKNFSIDDLDLRDFAF